MTDKLTKALLLEIRRVLICSVGFSKKESLRAVQKALPNQVSELLFIHTHAALCAMGCLRTMGFCVDYANARETTYCWHNAPAGRAYVSDLLVVCRVNHAIEHAGQASLYEAVS